MRRPISEDELFVVYAAIGKGVWMLQNVEDALHVYVVLKTQIGRPGTVAEKEAEGHLAKQRAHPLGRSIGIAEKGDVLSPELLAELKEFKEERDWLVHRSILSRGDLYLDGAREALVERIERFSERALRLQGQICKEMVVYGASVGVSPQRVTAEGNKILNRLRGTDV